MELANINGHTVDLSLLQGGVIIDIGCRDFKFAKYFAGREVYCVDPDKTVFEAAVPNHITCIEAAIWDKDGEAHYYENGEMTCVQPIWEPYKHKYFPCKTMTMHSLYMLTGMNVDLLKLDCEGAEYIIFDKDFQAVPKQISVEFHRHMMPEVHEKKYPSSIKRLLKYYDLAYQHETLMDSLFIRK